MDSNEISVSQNLFKKLNEGKKRKVIVDSWQCKAKKLAKDKGEAYTGRSGKENNAKMPPEETFHCGQRCTKAGCQLPHDRKLKIFFDFWKLGDHVRQSETIARMVDIVDVGERRVPQSSRSKSVKYYLTDDDGRKHQTCLNTFLHVLGIKYSTVRGVTSKMSEGETAMVDGRGKYSYNPRALDPNAQQMILDHIRSFPLRLSHYSRNDGNPLREYLDPSLSIRKMFNLFYETLGSEVETWEFKYRQVFREHGFRIGCTRSDTCDRCDKLFIEMTCLNENIAANAQRLDEIYLESTVHHHEAEVAYGELRNDKERSRIDPAHVVLCVDMQAVYPLPELTNSQQYYLRKLSCLNLGIYETSNDDTTMCLWTERDAGRGAEEVFSCVYKFIHENFEVLGPNEEKSLIIWSDRCVGQNNNYMNICGYRLLIAQRYFTEITQKFMVTGHSFLPCDRQFALIENARKRHQLYEPKDLISLIQSARPSNPFQIQTMTLTEFLKFEEVLLSCPRPTQLRVTHAMRIRVDYHHPNSIFVSEDHELAPWVEYQSVLRRNLNLCLLPQKNVQALALTPALLADLRVSYDFLPHLSRAFWNFVL